MSRTLWAYSDESGSPTFLVIAVVITGSPETVEEAQLALERSSGRGKLKWVRSTEKRKEAYLAGLAALLKLTGPIYWRTYKAGGHQVEQVADTVADGALKRDPDAVFRVQVDGFNEAECQVVRRAFSARGVRFRRIVGGRDETAPLLRFVDALAGFLNDVQRAKDYTRPWWSSLSAFFERL